MTAAHVEVLVEEPSSEAALQILLPRILGETSFAVYQHQCKDQLLKQLPQRLKGYQAWLPDKHRIIVIVDRDDDNCMVLKQRLESITHKAGLTTRANGEVVQVVNRIAIEELEAWFFGDWDAVCAAYPKVSPTIPSRVKFRDPDAIGGGTWEAFERVLKSAGYFRTGLRKIEAARAVATHMQPERNTSRSFITLRNALAEMAT